MQILDHKQISQKIERVAYQIYENNYNETQIIIAGINNNGMAFAEYLLKALNKISDIKIILANIKLNPASPLKDDISIDMKAKDMKDKVIIMVDDVANTGRTLFFGFKAINEVITKKIEVAVMVDRQHKNFPIKVDYVGMSLATTIKENIKVQLKPKSSAHVTLE